MKLLQKLLMACVPLAALTACGGGDTADRFDVADPAVRFVHAAPTAPAVTLYRASAAQPDATNVSYRFASNYFDVNLGVADWSVKSASGSTQIGSVSIDPQRGTKYTVVTLDTSAATSGAYLITDPYNKPLTSDSAHLRLMNAAYNAGSVDIYMNTPGTNIAGVNPLIPATAIRSSGPAPGQDSVAILGGTYPADGHAGGHQDHPVPRSGELREQPGPAAVGRADDGRAGLDPDVAEDRGRGRHDRGGPDLTLAQRVASNGITAQCIARFLPRRLAAYIASSASCNRFSGWRASPGASA